MSKKKIYNISKNYFNYFQKKNIQDLDDLFAANIVLKDWDNFAVGKKKVLAFNIKLFRKFKKISVNLKDAIFIDNYSIVCFITIKLNKKILNVIDILEFNRKYKIKKIRAYLG
jgi:hypothetical protein